MYINILGILHTVHPCCFSSRRHLGPVPVRAGPAQAPVSPGPPRSVT